jgi:hypothetical protein
MTVNLQQSPYLQLQRNFPNDDIESLSVTLDVMYVDVAQKMNARTIGLFATNLPSITGESWYLNGQPLRQQTLRRVYQFAGYAPIPHGIDFAGVSFFTVIRGIGFDGTNYFPIPYVTQTIPNGNVGIYVDPTNINFTSGIGSPVIVSGLIILEWLSNF